ncbi:MAG: cytidylate kinase-like family protein [Desulfobacteraceae bacterium]|nr:cytidylate kinase-like family protein [Pseudomonadota bacterium]MBU4463789.1 cytidylate kinase-like family protein [Pseudomonadota bacterium]MCG2755739.1 cytidylate kinase-like family protein [Desulfobacteraceae bacterium]
MSIITITAGSYSNGRQIAKSAAKRLNYEYIDSENISLLVSKEFGVPESNIMRALKETPSSVGMFSKAKPEYIIFIETLIAEYLLKNNIVYYGVVVLPLIQEVSHVLKVQIIADLESRIKNRMKLDNVSQDKARKTLVKEDNQQKKWAEAVYNIDLTDPNLYDLVINIGHIQDDDVEGALETIISTVKHKKFQPMTYSLRCMKNVAMSCRVRATLADIDSKMQVKSDEGTVYTYTKAIKKKAQDKVLEMKQKVMRIEGVKHIEVFIDYDLFTTVAHGQ